MITKGKNSLAINRSIIKFIGIFIIFFYMIWSFFGIIKVVKIGLYTLWYTNIHLEKCYPNTYNKLVSYNINIFWDPTLRPRPDKSYPKCYDHDLGELMDVLSFNIFAFFIVMWWLLVKKQKQNYIISTSLKIMIWISLFLLLVLIIILILNYKIKMLELPPFYPLLKLP